jgi:1-acyl-sn-glycerol-3-phosphate acyltransferase
MKKIRINILPRLYAFWALIWFVITMLIIWLPTALLFVFPEPKRTIYFIKISRIWMGVYLPLAGVRLKIEGKENFKKGQSYVVVCNHNSFMDIPISSPGIPGGNKTIAKVELSRIPLFGMIYKRGSVLVDRKSEQSRKKSYLQMKQVLDWGLHMCIYPEGTRNKSTDPLKPFKDGAFRLAIETGTSIIPAIITGTKEMLPANIPFCFRPGKVKLIFLPPISTTGLNIQELPNLKNQTFQQMWEKIEQERLLT